MRTVKRGFEVCSDRYKFDRSLTSGQGWAQVDTGQDAPYFGIWANPYRLEVFTYCEGDIDLVKLDTKQEFKSELEDIKIFYDVEGYGFKGIDSGFNKELKQEFIDIGLENLLH